MSSGWQSENIPISPFSHRFTIPGRGSRRAPECSTELRLSRSFALPLWSTIRAPVHRRLPASPPLPHGRGSWLTAWSVVRGAALPGGPATCPIFWPHSGSVGGRGWDGETVKRTLADRTRRFHFAGSQASADSSFHLTQRRKGAKMKCWESDHFVLTLRLCAFA